MKENTISMVKKKVGNIEQILKIQKTEKQNIA